jgi:3-oxoacyl-[acyl-carrier protein] reductase
MSTVFITGGSRGIGAAVARTFAYKGWDVAFSYLQAEDSAHALLDELITRGVGAAAYQVDVSDPAQVQGFVDAAVRDLGEPDALVCNAGIALPQDVLTHVSDEDWRRLFAVNVDGTFYTVRAVLPYFLHRHQGSIVTVSSMWGQVGGSCEVAYSATKGAIIAFTKALAKEVGPSGIRVNCVAPGVIDTDMNAHLSQEDMQALAEEIPLGRIGVPYEVARCVRYLCTDGAEYITGQVIAPNGGIVI